MTVSGGSGLHQGHLRPPTVTWQGKPITFNADLLVENGTISVPVGDVVSFIGASLERRTAKPP